jgi:hypothetical protein
MFGNIIVLLIILALAVLFAWLTWRAVRARKLWLKIAGGLGAGLLTLLFVVVAFLGAKGLLAMYAPGAPEPRQITVAGTPEQIARGEYLVDISCVACHGAPTADNQMTAEHPLSGGFNLSKVRGLRLHRRPHRRKSDPGRQAGRLYRWRAVPGHAPRG